VSKKAALKKKFLDGAHTSRYSIHLGSTKMYHDIRQQFWWTRMKHEMACYVSECDTCRKVKADYIKPRGLLQPLRVLNWKWDDISIDLVVGLSLTTHKFNSIWVIMDRLTKSAHFIPVNTNYNVQKYAEIYIARVLCLHGVLKMIVSDRGLQCVTRFWEQLHMSLDSYFSLSPADGWPNRTSQQNSRRYAKSLRDGISW
jgi:hypothetical protein